MPTTSPSEQTPCSASILRETSSSITSRLARYLHRGHNVLAAEVFPHHHNLSLGATAFFYGIDFQTLVSYRVLQVIGIPLIFIPISTLNYVGVHREKFNQVSGISNFTRNLGGAIGVSLLSNFVTQQRQLQRNTLAGHTNNGNPFFTRMLNGMSHQIASTGMGAAEASHKALAQISAQMDLQASVLAFKNAFWVIGVLVLVLAPLPFIMKRPSKEETEAAAAAH